MDREELIEFLKQNLRIETGTRRVDNYSETTVTILLEGEVITSDTFYHAKA